MSYMDGCPVLSCVVLSRTALCVCLVGLRFVSLFLYFFFAFVFVLFCFVFAFFVLLLMCGLGWEVVVGSCGGSVTVLA